MKYNTKDDASQKLWYRAKSNLLALNVYEIISAYMMVCKNQVKKSVVLGLEW